MDALLDDLRETRDRVAGIVQSAAGEGRLRAASDADLIDATALAGDLHRLAEALLIEAAGEVNHRSEVPERSERLSTRMGCHNPNELLQRLTRQAPATVARWGKAAGATGLVESLLGEQLPPMLPAVRAALVGGEIGVDGALAIAAPLTGIRHRVGREEILLADEVLAGHARGTGPDGAPPACADELKMHATAWAAALDPDGDEPVESMAARRRGLTLGPVRDGLVPIRGNLMAEVAAQLQRIIDASTSPYTDGADGPDAGGVQFRPSPPEDESAGQGVDEFAVLDDRTRTQKQHDALATALFVAASSQALPTIGGAAPTLVVAITEEDLTSGTGHAHIDGTAEALPVRTARHTACAGVIQRVTLGADGRILRLGTEERVFNRHQRRAIALRDGGCIIPGCGVPAAWCEIHHVTDHAKGGPTHTDNGVLLCWFHHRFIDTGPWQIRMNRGVPEVKAPTWFDKSDQWRQVTKSRTRMLSMVGRRT